MLNSFRRRLRQLLVSNTRPSRRRRSGSGLPAEVLEERICPTNLNFLPSGLVQFGGGNGNNNLTISVAGDTYTFNDPGETINVIGANVPPGTAGDGTNTVTFDASAAVVALQRIIINTNGGTDTVTVTSFRAGAEGLEIRDTGAGDTVNINGNVGTMANPVATYGVTIAATQINLGAQINTNNLAVVLTGPVGLTANSAIDSGTGALDINGAIDGAFSLSATGGFTTLDGEIGGTTEPTGLTVTGETTGVRVQDVSVDGAVSLTGNSVLAQGSLTGDGTGPLSISQFTNGNDLVLTFVSSDEVTNFSAVNLGNSNTGHLQLNNDGDGNVQTTGSLRPGSAITLTGEEVTIGESIDQGTSVLTVNVDNNLNWAGQGAAIGTGNVNINKSTMSGTLTIQGKMGAGKQQWGANALTVTAPGATVSFEGEVSTNLASFTANAATLDFSAVPGGAAVGAGGDVDLTGTTAVILGGGLLSQNGSINVSGAVTLTKNTTIRASSGGSVTIINDVTSAANHNLIVRGISGGLLLASFSGNVSGVGSFQVDGTPATNVSLKDVTATNIIVRGTDIALDGNLTVTNHGLGLPEGNLHLVGNVTLFGATQLNYSADTLNRSVIVNGTINGANDLTIDSGIGTVSLTGAIGGGTALTSMTVTSLGISYLTVPITVENDFSWTVGTNGNGINDRLIRAGAGSITSNSGNVTLIADKLQGFLAGTNVTAPSGIVTLTERGAGD